MRIARTLLALAAAPCRYVRNWLAWQVALGQSPPSRDMMASALRGGRAERQPQKPVRPARYVATSLFLHQCWRYLTRTPCEDLHLVTGVLLDGQFVLNELVTVPNVRRSHSGASAGPLDVREGLFLMESYGLRCGALMHSHPGRGPSSTSPSSTDWENQRIWEAAYPLVGGIVSQDGCVRFFSNSPEVQVEVIGKKVSKIRDNLFKLEVEKEPDPRVAVPGTSHRSSS